MNPQGIVVYKYVGPMTAAGLGAQILPRLPMNQTAAARCELLMPLRTASLFMAAVHGGAVARGLPWRMPLRRSKCRRRSCRRAISRSPRDCAACSVRTKSIADSPVDLAADMRRQIRECCWQARSDQQIRDFMVSRYGEFILFRPRFVLNDAWLWLTPGCSSSSECSSRCGHPPARGARRDGPGRQRSDRCLADDRLHRAGCRDVGLGRRGRRSPCRCSSLCRQGRHRTLRQSRPRRVLVHGLGGALRHVEQLVVAHVTGHPLARDGRTTRQRARRPPRRSHGLAHARALVLRAAGISPGGARLRARGPRGRGRSADALVGEARRSR